ncbi:MAG: recombination mediator RecR [Elusimicrobiota bacterium]|nr:recombination mediator RecR [Elusimicrobiota bacterium]
MKSLEKIISLFRKFPGIGPKQAERFAMYVLKSDASEIEELAKALKEIKESVKQCRRCYNFSEKELCSICANSLRDQTVICVVEQPQDVNAIEKAKIFDGVYHVLHGAISPLKGRSFSSIKIKELMERIELSPDGISEIIIATNPDADGETTAIYLKQILQKYVPKITRIAYGVPLGGDIDYMDEMTLGYALRGRTKV